MPVLTPLVREPPARPDESRLFVADPVRAGTWLATAELVNNLLGFGAEVIPQCGIMKPIAVGATATYRYTIWPRYQASHRVWLIGLRAASHATITFTDPSGRSTTIPVTLGDGTVNYRHVETITARSSSETQVAVTIASSGSSADTVTPTTLQCFDIPRPELAVDASDLGVDLATFEPTWPIYRDQGRSYGGLGASLVSAREVAARNAHFAFARTAADAIEITGTAAPIFASAPEILERYLYVGETTIAVPVRIYTRSEVTTSGTIDFAMTSGGVLSIPVAANDTGTWRSGTIPVYVEDLGSSDGRRASTPDLMAITGSRTGGAGKVFLESVCIGRRSVT